MQEHLDSTGSYRRQLRRERARVAAMDLLLGQEREIVLTVREPVNRRLLGYSLFYEWGGWLWERSLHLAEELRTNPTPLMFELEFYLPMGLYFERGLRALHLGPASYESKLRRGTVPQPLWQVGLSDGEETYPADGVARWTTTSWAGSRPSATPGRCRRASSPRSAGRPSPMSAPTSVTTTLSWWRRGERIEHRHHRH
ncbi:hypothetical protein [Kitasatospora aureofaciens]|uniref:hypothetical protein n=1 Tax=Kitasatospora aureofaciens TaxID=1894 RepID=UPI001D8DB62F|nr:hypothetical protein [Kitasatospora aureofaciens]HJD81138.1 hypothetical protein [Kitasatospora aureofaciens]